MQFSFEDLQELRRHLRDLQLLQPIPESKITVAILHVIDLSMVIAISHSLTKPDQMGHLELDSESYLILSRAISKANPKLFKKVRHAIFLQSRKEAFL